MKTTNKKPAAWVGSGLFSNFESAGRQSVYCAPTGSSRVWGAAAKSSP